uniref:Putative secreted protein n=1 Tax=Ixodes ricinus TaxID=34613 RepID=A0A6B0V5N3_IXORI
MNWQGACRPLSSWSHGFVALGFLASSQWSSGKAVPSSEAHITSLVSRRAEHGPSHPDQGEVIHSVPPQGLRTHVRLLSGLLASSQPQSPRTSAVTASIERMHWTSRTWVPSPHVRSQSLHSPTSQEAHSVSSLQSRCLLGLGPTPERQIESSASREPASTRCWQNTSRSCVPLPQLPGHGSHSLTYHVAGQGSTLQGLVASGLMVGLHRSLDTFSKVVALEQYTARVWTPPPQVCEHSPKSPEFQL